MELEQAQRFNQRIVAPCIMFEPVLLLGPPEERQSKRARIAQPLQNLKNKRHRNVDRSFVEKGIYVGSVL
ncbi:hypothetical protein ACOSQ2_021898 [Xanthoceras sorbifolium]